MVIIGIIAGLFIIVGIIAAIKFVRQNNDSTKTTDLGGGGGKTPEAQ